MYAMPVRVRAVGLDGWWCGVVCVCDEMKGGDGGGGVEEYLCVY